MGNLTTTEGFGTQLNASEDPAEVKTQVIALALGVKDAVLNAILNFGQQLMAASLPVAIASDQSTLPVAEKGGGISAVTKNTISADATVTKMDLSAAPGSGKVVCCASLVICSAVDMTVVLNEESSATSLGTFYLKANVPLPISYGAQAPLKTVTANKKLQASTSISGNVSIQAICFPA